MRIKDLLKVTTIDAVCSLFFEEEGKWEMELSAEEILEKYSCNLVKHFYPSLQFTNCNELQLVIVL